MYWGRSIFFGGSGAAGFLEVLICSQDNDDVPPYFWVISFGWPPGNQGNAAFSADLFSESCATRFGGLIDSMVILAAISLSCQSSLFQVCCLWSLELAGATSFWLRSFNFFGVAGMLF
ncbi:hypothetical protein KFK09_000766 [Dendrobium nobile]|uniref:Uncharacterized protein n=1 Tax=Dendrobium nobile TaxID=94219 RepID=A0A8T3CFP8_DENNO|nr:hypothetical protein KFK09_000766 [Dendrobium nobile]